MIITGGKPDVLFFLLGFLACYLLFWVLALRARKTVKYKYDSWSGYLNPINVARRTYVKRSAHLLQSMEGLGTEMQQLIDRHELLTENLAAAIIIRDAESKITYCSTFTEVLTGYSTTEIYEAKEDFFLDIVHEQDKEAYQRALKVSEFGEAFQFRYRFFHKSGILMWAETRTVPIMDENGAVTSTLSITLDVTGTILYQRQVEEKNTDLQDFSYMVSHDLKAPIFTIKGMLGILEDEKESLSAETAKEPLEHINKAARKLEQLVGGVLEYARISNQDVISEEIDLNELVSEVISDYKHQLELAGGEISIEGKLNVVMADKIRAYQIFSNLIGNAIKYRSDKRKLKIVVRSEPTNSFRLCITSVSDNGLGIPEDKLDNIFRPFHRAHIDKAEGSGIGLACVKKLSEKLGGYVDAKSDVNEGSSFFVGLRRKE